MSMKPLSHIQHGKASGFLQQAPSQQNPPGMSTIGC